MKKNWKKPVLVVFNNSSILSGSLNSRYEVVKYCNGGSVKSAAGVGTITGTAGSTFPFRTAGNPNMNGQFGGKGTASTAGVSGC